MLNYKKIVKSGGSSRFVSYIYFHKKSVQSVKATILNASAGSGKTYQLAYKYVRDVVERPELYRHILAVTFTNKATEEMKSRILKEIHRLASGAESLYMADLTRELQLSPEVVRRRAAEARSKILHDYSRFTVLTIDTFFQRILRAFIKELSLDLNYNIEIETASVLAKSADALIEQIKVDPELLRWMTDFVQERIDDGDKWDLRTGMLKLGGEIFKEQNRDTIASMPSKKRLEEIVNHLFEEAEASQKRYREQARELLDAIAAEGLSADDFSRKEPVKFLQAAAAGDGVPSPPGVMIRERAASAASWRRKNDPMLPCIERFREMLQALCETYDRHVRHWNTCPFLRENYRSFALLSDLTGMVKQMCGEQNLMLLSETKNILSAFIRDNDAPFIYEKVGNRFERFMIDEFQDTSIQEWKNFLPLLQNALAQSEQNAVFIVGDIKQSIYRWRGGDWRILHTYAQRDLGAADTEVIQLEKNYRSLPVVVDFNNRAMAAVVRYDNAMLNLQLQSAQEARLLPAGEVAELHDTLKNAYLNHAQQACRRKEYDGYVSVELFDEQPPVVARICELIDRGFRPCDILILVRGRNEGTRVAAELLDFKRTNTDDRYRFEVMTREALLIGAAPVSGFVVAVLRLALNGDDSLSRADYNHFLERPFDTPLNDEEQAFVRSLRLLSPEDAFERILMRYGLQHAEQHTAYLQAIHERLINFCSGRVADIPLFLRWWEEQGASQSLAIERSENAIEITTIHKAKGLERKAVIIPWSTWKLDPRSSGYISNIVWAEAGEGEVSELGRFPVHYKQGLAQSNFSADYFRERVFSHVDSVNLLYVALTRAAESLHVFVRRDEAERPQPATAGALLWRVLCDPEDPEQQRIEFGTFTGPVASESEAGQIRHVVLHAYPTASPQLKLRLPSQRYFEEGERGLSPRNFGILMHKAFQEADTFEDMQRAVQQMHEDALLSDADAATLRQMIDRAVSDPTVRSWFDGSWECVRNENAIILPAADSASLSDEELTRRPDRVMLKGSRAVIVDYKFGKREGEEAAYRRQIRRYLDLVRRMGYTDCEGYLWYVRRGEIVRVE